MTALTESLSAGHYTAASQMVDPVQNHIPPEKDTIVAETHGK